MLHAEVVGHDARSAKAKRNACQVGGKGSLRASTRIVDIPVENIRAARKGRIVRTPAQEVGLNAVVENAEAASHGRLAIGSRVVGEADARPEIASIGGYAAAGQADEEPVHAGQIDGRDAALGAIRKTSAEDDDAVVGVAARAQGPVGSGDLGRVGQRKAGGIEAGEVA